MTIDVTSLVNGAEQAAAIATKVLPQVELVTGFIPGAAPAVAAEQAVGLMLPHLVTIIQFLAQETNKPIAEVVSDFLSHITPTMPAAAPLA
jgi:hypothetical protein